MKNLLHNWNLKDYQNAFAKAYLALTSTPNTDKKCYIKELKLLDMLSLTLGLNTDHNRNGVLNITNFNLS